jgi:glycosyltransferase involved in cell wall biosynthesis
MMPLPFFSIVIPFYNRAWSVERAIASAVSFRFGKLTEIILVDDGSTDGSADVVNRVIDAYKDHSHVIFKLITHERNGGVCAAKNTGGNAASGQWIIFLDSDDELIGACAEQFGAALNASQTFPLHFFACVEEGREIVAGPSRYSLRDFNTLLLRGTDGEALPVVRTEVFKKYGYDEDIRGYESLCYLRIVRDYSHAVIHDLIARRYYTEHADRLSSRAGMKARWRDLSRGHLRVLKEHKGLMSSKVRAKQTLRFLKSRLLSLAG